MFTGISNHRPESLICSAPKLMYLPDPLLRVGTGRNAGTLYRLTVGDSDISSGLELAQISCSLVSPDRVQMKAKWVLFVDGGVLWYRRLCSPEALI